MDDSTLIELFRVLGDPIRWRDVTELREGTRCACELAEASGVAPSLLSHHLGVLRDAGVVTASRRGKWVDYTVVDGVLEHLADELSDAATAHGGRTDEPAARAMRSEGSAG
jgi:ArsR family transcriptional regulator